MHSNRLALEKSPYLLQHAHNPVDWYAWGAEAFAKARAERKPIFLSIGYSTCHWCHVMERESFENESIAAQLNRDFVPIKVDREERPDVDRIYMAFVQAATGGGGWPMSVWLTPELQPFFGGTYFPPEDRWGHAGFSSVLTQIAKAWRTDRDRIGESAREALAQLEKHSAFDVAPAAIDYAAAESGFSIFRRTYDSEMGGFGQAPKFPRPAVFEFLLRYHARTGNREALEMTLHTLRKMAEGGVHDQLGGGFHRYSVDERWFVPHFEKMLYDQAQLATAYLEAFQITGEQLFAQTARRVFDYVLRDMTASEGGFYSAEDADSVVRPEEPTVKGEGAFYIWSAEEIREALSAPARAGHARPLHGNSDAHPAAEWFAYRYGVAEGGNVVNDPHSEFSGRNILYQAASAEETAEQFGRPVEEVRAGLETAEAALLKARAARVRPHLDDKILTAWNGMMISALALGGAVLEEPRYAETARRAADFALGHLFDPATGQLLRRYRDGEAAIPGFLEDYALFTQALLDLYEAQFDRRDLEWAVRLAEKQSTLFEDPAGGFFQSAAGDASLVLRLKEDYDGAEPSGNSIAILNLLRLAQITGRADFRASAERALAAFAPRLASVPVALPAMLTACEFYLAEPRQIVIVGPRDSAGTRALLRAFHARFVANRIVLLVDSEETRRALARGIPTIESMQPAGGIPSAYVCRNYACQLPVTEAAQLTELLQ
ncbi:MAG TPA: thioredoxin domain-containing protein [Bryobacteraceae bacterium]